MGGLDSFLFGGLPWIGAPSHFKLWYWPRHRETWQQTNLCPFNFPDCFIHHFVRNQRPKLLRRQGAGAVHLVGMSILAVGKQRGLPFPIASPPFFLPLAPLLRPHHPPTPIPNRKLCRTRGHFGGFQGRFCMNFIAICLFPQPAYSICCRDAFC